MHVAKRLLYPGRSINLREFRHRSKSNSRSFEKTQMRPGDNLEYRERRPVIGVAEAQANT